MESATSIRVSNPMLTAWGSTCVLEEYGIRVADPALIAKARAIIDHLVAAADARFTAHVETRKRLSQSPYDDVVVNGLARRQVAIIGMGSYDDFRAELEAHFGVMCFCVDKDQLMCRICQVLGKLLEDRGFEVSCEKPSFNEGIMLVIVRDPVHIEAIDVAEGRRFAVCGDMGVTTPCSPRRLAALRKVIDGLCNDALDNLTYFFAARYANGGSPFSSAACRSYEPSRFIIADSRRVSHKDHAVTVNYAANVPLIMTSVLRERAKQAVGEHVHIDSAQLERDFMINFLTRVSARRGLMVAGVWNEGPWFTVVCSPEPSPLSCWLGRIAQYFARKGRELRAALPAPKESAKALPPPAEPVMVPPIAVPSTFFGTKRKG